MTKNELIEAINATIVPNGQKAITAESLANLLMEMVNATPEGSAASGGVVFTLGSPNEEFSEFVLSDTEKAHNAAMFVAIANAAVMPCVCVDITGLHIALLAQDGINAVGIKVVEPAMEAFYLPEELAEEMDGERRALIDVVIEIGKFYFYADGTFQIVMNE